MLACAAIPNKVVEMTKCSHISTTTIAARQDSHLVCGASRVLLVERLAEQPSTQVERPPSSVERALLACKCPLKVRFELFKLPYKVLF